MNAESTQFTQAPRDRALGMIRSADRIFIAYSHSDLKAAARIRRKLIRRRNEHPPESVFVDQESLTPGDEVNSADVEKHLADSDLVIVICGADTARRNIVRDEIRMARVLRDEGRCQILPVILKSGVTLPEGLDYEIHGIFLTNLFPEVRWQRIAITIASTFLVAAVVLAVARSAWAVWLAPPERWTLIDLPLSGYTQAVLVEPRPGEETIRAYRTSTTRGRFAEDVDNTNHLFVEINLSGEITGAFATTRDDAGTFPDYRETERFGGAGTLADDVARYQVEPESAAAVWAHLASSASQCVPVTFDNGLDEVLEIVEERFGRVRYQNVLSRSCGSGFIITIVPSKRHTGGRVLLIDDQGQQQVTDVAFDNLKSISRRDEPASLLLATTVDTRWEDAGNDGGLFASKDGGLSWSRLPLGEGAEIYVLGDVAAGLGNSRRIAVSYAAQEGGNYGVIVSDDDGGTWGSLRRGLSGETPEEVGLVGVTSDDSVLAILPGGRLASWRRLTFAEKFIGMNDIQL